MEIALMETQKEVTGEIDKAKALVITSNQDYSLADSVCAGLLAFKKKIEADFKDSKAKAYDAWKAIVAQEKGHLDGIDEARKIYKGKMDAWREEQERIRLAEEERLRAEAQRAAEEQQLAQAQAAEESGDNAQAEAIIAAPVQVAPIVLAKSVPKATTTFRKVWKYRIRDASKIPAAYLMPDEKKIGGVVRSMGAATSIPGIEVYSENV